MSASSPSKLSKFLILQFLVKCSKLHSVFKILPKLYMLDIFFNFISVLANFHINYGFIFSKSLNCPNLSTNEQPCGTLIVKIKKPSIFACSVVTRVFICASNEPLCGTLIINLRIFACCKEIKASFARIK